MALHNNGDGIRRVSVGQLSSLQTGTFIAFHYEGQNHVGRLVDVWQPHPDLPPVFELVDMDGWKAPYQTGLIEGSVHVLGRRV